MPADAPGVRLETERLLLRDPGYSLERNPTMIYLLDAADWRALADG